VLFLFILSLVALVPVIVKKIFSGKFSSEDDGDKKAK
jgi:hypothetical protein